MKVFAKKALAKIPSLPKSSIDEFLYAHWAPISLSYLAPVVSLVLGIFLRSPVPLYVMVFYFTIWDLYGAVNMAVDRNAQETMESSTRARQYMSHFIILYGAAIAFFVQEAEKDNIGLFLELFDLSGIPVWVVLSPLFLWASAMMFFPITLALGSTSDAGLEQCEPTKANLAVFWVNAWAQKVGTFTFVYCLVAFASAVPLRDAG